MNSFEWERMKRKKNGRKSYIKCVAFIAWFRRYMFRKCESNDFFRISGRLTTEINLVAKEPKPQFVIFSSVSYRHSYSMLFNCSKFTGLSAKCILCYLLYSLKIWEPDRLCNSCQFTNIIAGDICATFSENVSIEARPQINQYIYLRGCSPKSEFIFSLCYEERERDKEYIFVNKMTGANSIGTDKARCISLHAPKTIQESRSFTISHVLLGQ